MAWPLSPQLSTVDAPTRKALWYSFTDGVFATVMIALVETFAVAGAIALHMPSLLLALLGPLPVWVGTLVQWQLHRRGAGARARKPLVIATVRLQALWLVALGLSGFVPGGWAPYLYFLAFLLQGASGASGSHLWMSWFADCCPEDILGRHAAWRSAVFACVQLAVALLAGMLTRRYVAGSTPFSVFFVVFATAGLARWTSSLMMSRQGEPPPSGEAPGRFVPSPALVRFSVAVALLQGAAVMSGPFFSLWFLRDLQLTYLEFATASAATVLGNLLASPFIGALSDRFGSVRVLKIGAWLAAVVPIPYLWLSTPLGVWLSNLYSGAAWATVNVSAFKTLLSTARGKPNQHTLVYANLWLTTCGIGFSLVGGYLATRLPTWFTWQLQSLFFLSILLRLTVAGALMTRLTDPALPGATPSPSPGRFFQIFRWKGPGTADS